MNPSDVCTTTTTTPEREAHNRSGDSHKESILPPSVQEGSGGTIMDWNKIRISARGAMPAAVWRTLKRLKRAARQLNVRNFLEMGGYLATRKKDYYSPLASVAALRCNPDRWNRPSALKGIDYDLDQMKRDMSGLLSRYWHEFSELPAYEKLQQIGFGPGYTAVDALTLYMTVRHVKPKRYIEIGSGLSTYYCSLAAARNAAEGHPLEITCIEPHPFAKLYEIPGIRVINKEVQDVEVSQFLRLEDNDIIFIDSSHVLKIDGDVPFLFLEVVPQLKVGVVVHVHDVPFPYNIPYPPQRWIFDQTWPMFWNEAMVLQAFLCFNKSFKITMSTPLIRHYDEAFLKQSIPTYESVDENPSTFSSLWMKRVA